MLSNTSDELLPKIEKIANLGLYEVNIPSGIWRGSDNFIKIFGLSKKEQYTQEEFQAIVHPEDFEDVMGYYQHCLELQKDFNYEYRCVRPDGEVICVSSRSKITYSNDGTPQKVVGIKQDISEHKKTERKLQQLNKLIQRKDEILGEVAHDLRAPLAQIMMLAMFFEHRLKGKDRELFQLLKQTCLTTEDIISELIEIAQLEKFGSELNRAETEVNEVVKKSIKCYKFKLEEKNLQLETSFAKNSNANVDGKKVRRLVDNLLSNAIKFTPQGGSIKVSTQREDGKIWIVIDDNGIGIAEEEIPLLFDSNAKIQRRAGTSGEPSTGLGLNIVKQIVDLHEGEIKVKSEVGKGTKFIVSLDQKLN